MAPRITPRSLYAFQHSQLYKVRFSLSMPVSSHYLAGKVLISVPVDCHFVSHLTPTFMSGGISAVFLSQVLLDDQVGNDHAPEVGGIHPNRTLDVPVVGRRGHPECQEGILVGAAVGVKVAGGEELVVSQRRAHEARPERSR